MVLYREDGQGSIITIIYAGIGCECMGYYYLFMGNCIYAIVNKSVSYKLGLGMGLIKGVK